MERLQVIVGDEDSTLLLQPALSGAKVDQGRIVARAHAVDAAGIRQPGPLPPARVSVNAATEHLLSQPTVWRFRCDRCPRVRALPDDLLRQWVTSAIRRGRSFVIVD